MHHLNIFLSLLFCIFIQSCQLLPNHRSAEQITPLSEEQEQVFSLLRQAKRYDELSKLHRQAVCKRLKLDYQEHTDWQTAWLLVYSLNDNFNCISLNKSIQLLQSIQADKNSNRQLQWMNKNQIKLLKVLNNYQKYRNSLRLQLKNSKEQLKDSQEQLKKENIKIEELKAIETSINKKLDNE